MPPEVNWAKIREEYESADILLKDLAAKHGLKEGTVRSRKNREGWSRVATQKDNATQRDTHVATQKHEEPEQPPFPGQCEAIGHKSGKRCVKKAVPGESFCVYHMDGHRENQCTATSKQTGERCRRLAEPGKRTCKFHGGKSTGPVGHQNNLKHGFYAKIFPDDEDTRAIIHEIMEKSPLDILWDQIVIQYTAIARAQKIMFVRDKHDMTQIKTMESSGMQSDTTAYMVQTAWDKQANFLHAQSKAMKTLEGLISRYEDLVEKYELKGMVVEEHRLRVEKLKSDMAIARERLEIEKEKANLGGQDTELEVVIDYGDNDEC